MSIIDPNTILVAVPCGDGRIMSETCGALVLTKNRYHALTMPAENSHVGLVRNIIAANFLQNKQWEWLVTVDSDIHFHPQDMDFLLEPANDEHKADNLPQPTRTLIPLIEGRDKNGQWLRAVGAADMLVYAEYPYKNDSCEPVQMGMGFTRTHRSVFEKIAELKHPPTERHAETLRAIELLDDVAPDFEGKSQVRATLEALAAENEGGTPRVWQTMHKGMLLSDFYPSGGQLAQSMPVSGWKGEDHGFFTLAMLAGVIPRVERRTQLTHIGRKGYHYQRGVTSAQ